MKILITGDLVINKVYDSSLIDDNIISMFKTSDYNITNLEAPITDSSNKILKTGPHIKGNKKSTLDVLTMLNINAVTLANNHVLDYDEKGVIDTLYFCNENKIETVGAGRNLDSAKKTLFIVRDGLKIAIINFAENEWSSASPSSAGSNPLDLIENLKMIREARYVSEYVIVIIHGGHEYYNLPSPRMQKLYRFFADEGADIVIGHHPHCISGHEVYNNVPIYYSLGNFLFTKNSLFDDWYLGLILEIEFKDRNVQAKLHPIQQNKENFQLSLLEDDEKTEIMHRLDHYDEVIADPSKLKGEWQKYVESKYQIYLRYWSVSSFIKNRYIKGILNKFGAKVNNKHGLKLFLNLMRCESHADLSKEIVQKYLTK